MNDIERKVLVQSSSARLTEAIQGCRKRRTGAKQVQEYSTLIGKLNKIFPNVKAKSDRDIKIIDEIAINVYNWLQTYQQDKEIKSNIIKILVTTFNS